MKRNRLNRFISLLLSALMISTFLPSVALAAPGDTYTVTFYGWGDVLLDSQNVPEGGNATPPTGIATPDGYQHTGWSGTYTNVTKPESVYAQFKKEYTVTFLGGASSSDVLKSEVVLDGGSATAPDNKGVPAGQKFVGWDPSDFSNVTSDLNVTAQYAPLREYTVTFLGGIGGIEVLGTGTVLEFNSASVPTDKKVPDPSTQRFDHWDSDAYMNVTGDTLTITIHAVYAPIPTHEVKFFGGLDGNTQIGSTQNIIEGNAAVAPSEAAVLLTLPADGKTYRFTGWDVSFNNITASLNVKAQFIQTYTLTYAKGTATGTPPAPQVVDVGSSVTVLIPNGLTPPTNDPLFYYWSDSVSGSNYRLGSTITPTANMTLTAIWGKGWHLNLSYSSGGVAGVSSTSDPVYPVNPNPDKQDYPAGHRIYIYATPSIGYKIGGFYKNKGGSDPRTDVVNVGNNIYYVILAADDNTNMLYVKFVQAPESELYNVIYVKNYGTGGTGSAPVDRNDYAQYNTATVLGQNSMSWPGHEFLGWSTTQGATEPTYHAGDTFSIPAHDVTLYGVWSTLSYTVTYAANNGTGVVTTDPNQLYGSKYTVLGNTFTAPTNKHFTGWNTSAGGGGTSYAEGDKLTITGNVTLYAQWAFNAKYSVTYNKNGGGGSSLTDPSIPYYVNTSFTVLANTFTPPANKHFIGWNTAANGTGTDYTAGTSYTITGNVTLYAQWAYNPQYTVTYLANGGSGSTTDPSSPYYENSRFTVRSSTFTVPANKHFTGWNTAADGSGTNYSVGTSYTITGNVMLYAQWAFNAQYTVTYYANGGTGTMADTSSPYYANNSFTVLENTFTAPTNKHFAGWDTDPDGHGTNYNAGSSYTITGNVKLYAQWDWNEQYWVLYDSNGGLGLMYDWSNPYFDGTSVTVKSNEFYAPWNKHFVGWNTARNGGGTSYAPGASFTVTDDVTLYAQWANNTQYTVSYNANGGSGSMTDSQSPYINITSFTVLSNTFTAPANKHFTGWNSAANGSGTSYTAGSTYTLSGNVTLYAQWAFNAQYTVSYNANGGSGSMTDTSSPYYDGNSFTVLTNAFTAPTNKHFAGWNTAANGSGTTYATGSSNVIHANVTLYAQWEYNAQYTVSYNANGGSGSMTDTSSPYYDGNSFTVMTNAFTAPTNKHFAGWNTAANGSGTSYTEGSSYAISANVTLYAQWEYNEQFTVSYNENGGTGTMTDTSSPYYDGNLFTVMTNAFTAPTNKHFAGWNTAANGSGTSYTEGSSYAISANVTLYAQWEYNEQFTVTYNENGGTGTMTDSSSPYYDGNLFTVLTNAFTAPAYMHFTGWNDAADGSGTAYATGSSNVIHANVTLYAQWALDEYTVTYLANGGTGTTTDLLNPHTALTTYTVLANTFTRADYVFDHWNTAADGTGTTVAVGSTQTITANTTYYAIWTPAPYAINYILNGGANAATNPAIYTIESPAITLDDAIQPGYTFLGWTPAGGIPTGSSGVKTFTANWSAPIPYDINYVLNGGTNAVGNPATYTVESPTITLAGATRPGYDFLGWTPDGTIPAGSTGDVTFTARWSDVHTHTVMYFVNGGTNAGLDGATPYRVYNDVAYGTVVPVPANPAQDNYTFGGWTTAIPVNMPDQDVVIYGTLTQEPVPPEIITNDETPLAGGGPTWALLNLIMTITNALGISSIFTMLKKKRAEELTKQSKAFRWSTVIPAAAAILAFILTQNLKNSTMVLTDQWTLLMGAITLIQAVVVGLGFGRKWKFATK